MTSILLLSERLATTFASETLRAAALFAFVALVLKLIPRISASIRSLVWTIVLLVAIAMPFFPSASPARHPAGAHMLHFAPTWSLAIAAVWLLAGAFRAAGLFTNALRLRAIWRRAEPIPNIPAATIQAFAGRTRTATLALSRQVVCPSVIGFFSPRILIPETLYPRLSKAELDHVILHEMEHLRRFDDWRNLFQKLALVLFPLNPAFFWIDRRLSLERELACDESVLQATRAPRSYASSLVRLAEESALGRHLALALGAWERRSELARRVENIIAYRSPSSRGPLAAGALVAATLTAGATLAHIPGFVDFSQPAESVAFAVPAPTAAVPYRNAAFHLSQAGEPHAEMIETVAHLPASQKSPVLRSVLARPRPLPAPAAAPPLRRVHREVASAPLYTLTTWVIAYDRQSGRATGEPQVTFTVFTPAGAAVTTPRAPKALSPEVRLPEGFPAAGGFIFFSL